MSQIDYKYVDILEDIMTYGYDYEDPNRVGVKRKELEYVNIKHLVQEGFPIVTARKTFFKGAVGELLLFLKGSTDIRDYWDYGIRFWDNDFKNYHKIDEEGFDRLYRLKDKEVSKEFYSMGKIYGHQYKQQYHVFDDFKENPLRTDLIVNSWQIQDLKDMCLKPCHFNFQITGSSDGFMIVYSMRSVDFLLGQPINIQFYYLMGMLLEFWSGHKFNGVIGSLVKVHLYDNQFKLADQMIKLPTTLYKDGAEVTLTLDENLKDLPFEEFIKHVKPSDFKLENYEFVIDESVSMLAYNKLLHNFENKK